MGGATQTIPLVPKASRVMAESRADVKFCTYVNEDGELYHA